MAAATTLDLQRGRTLVLEPAGDEDLIEVRAPSGTVEIRLRITDDGPVLELESVRLALRAARSVDVETSEFTVRADEISLAGKADVRIDADGEVVVTGEMIRLN
jgi:phage baseplate assembly protein gpV